MKIEYFALPTPIRFHASTARVRGLMGPFGSGKSSACCWEVFGRAHRQTPGADGKRRTRWAVVRNTYPELRDTSIKTWKDWFGRVGRWHEQEHTHYVSYGDIECEVMFRALDRPDDVRKLLSMELTGAWVNEAREVPWAIIEGLDGRIDRFPAQRDGGATWAGMILDTNPPDSDHWWYKKFEEEKPEGWELFRQPSGLSPEAENIENLPERYYEKLAIGKSADFVKVYVKGEYGFFADGRPVYPEFVDSFHVAEQKLEAIPGLPIGVGLDFGLTPAAVFGQRTPMGQARMIHELATEELGAERFAKLLKQEIGRLYPQFEFQFWGDPAGEIRAQTDERTVFDILRANGIPARPAPCPNNDFTMRREAVASPLTRIVDGKPAYIMSPTCKVLRKAKAGAYQFRRIQVVGQERWKDVPDKNFFSHTAEAEQYLMLGWGEGHRITRAPGRMASRPMVADRSFDVFA